MKANQIAVSLIGVMTLLVAVPAAGDDLSPPPWRGEEGSTFQHWSFDAQPADWDNVLPETVSNPYGTPSAEVFCGPMCTPDWHDNWEGRQGVVRQLEGWMDLDIPDRAEPLQGKEVWVQVVYECEDIRLEGALTPQGPDSYTVTLIAEETTTLEGDWRHALLRWQITPNPDSETIRLEIWEWVNPLVVDQIVVDTICTDALPTGACCNDLTGVCTDSQTEGACVIAEGRYGGDESECATIDPPCVAPPTGACCDDATGICTEDMWEWACLADESRYGGNGSTCATIDPPCEVGACCHGEIGVCNDVDYWHGFTSGTYVAYDPEYGSDGQVLFSHDHPSPCMVHFWDLASGTERGSVPTVVDAHGLTVDSIRRRAFVRNRLPEAGPNCVAIIDADAMTLNADVALPGEPGVIPHGMDVVPSTGKVVVTVYGGSQGHGVMLVDPDTESLEGALQNIHHMESFDAPFDVAVLEENGLSVAVVANDSGAYLTLVPLADITFVPGEEPPGGPLPPLPKIPLNYNYGVRAIVGDPPNNRAMVAWTKAGGGCYVQVVTVTSNTTGSASERIYVGSGFIERGLDYDPVRDLLYVASGSSATRAFDLVRGIVIGNLYGLDTTSRAVAAAPARESVFIVGNGPNMSERCPVFCDDSVTPGDCEATWGLYAGQASNCASDCQPNGVADDCDFAYGTSEDCQGNGVPDECDIAQGTSNDCEPNEIPDECDIAGCLPEDPSCQDCNNNGVPDACDIVGITSEDCQPNGVPDECDIAEGTSVDDDGDVVPNECDNCDLYNPNQIDCQPNDIGDVCDIAYGPSEDCQPNEVPDECDIAGVTSEDCQPNEVPDECDITGVTSEDCQPNEIPDECDIAGVTSEDCQPNEVPDECDITGVTSEDCQPNEVPDECDITGVTSEDCQPNEIPDECDIADCLPEDLSCRDCNENDAPDECDISAGTSQDDNENSVPDECDGKRPMAEDCASIPPGTKCSDARGCSTDTDCWDESICVLPPTGERGDGVCYAPKMRYISLRPLAGETNTTARRIKLSNDTTLGWVGEPTWHASAGVCLASVVDTPQYSATWVCAEAPDEAVHVMGCRIAHASLCPDMVTHCLPNHPGYCADLPMLSCETTQDCIDQGAVGPCVPWPCTNYRYWVQAIAQGQDIGDESNYSEALELVTNTTWGDTVSTCDGNKCRPPNGLCGLDDIMAAIGYFQGVTDLAPLTWVDIDPSNQAQSPEQIIGLGDMMAAIAGFQSEGYPGLGPLNCP